MLPHELHADARQEVDEAFEWYESHVPGLGQGFLTELDDALAAIAEMPDAWPRFSRGTRRYRMHRFPYGVVYLLDQNRIRVFAVMHLSRRPGYWFDRL